MAYQTLLQLGAILDRKIHDVITGTLTSNGAADGTTIIDTSLLQRSGQPFVPLLVELTSGTYSGQIRPTAKFEVVSGAPTLTLRYAFGGQVVSGVTYKLHSFLPSEKKSMISDALAELMPVVPYRVSEVLTAGELLRNSQLQFWRTSALPYDWDVVAGTVARTVASGETRRYVLSLTGTGSVGSVRQQIPHVRILRGASLTFTAYVYGTANAGIVLRVFQDTTISNSAALTVSNTWTKLSVTFTVLDSLEPIFVELRNTSAGAVLFRDAQFLPGGTTDVLWLPHSEIYRTLANVEIGISTTTTEPSSTSLYVNNFQAARMPHGYHSGYGWYDALPGLPVGYFLRLTGEGFYPALSADADEVELENDAADYLATLAGIRLMTHVAKASDHLAQKDHWGSMQADLERERDMLTPIVRRARPGVRLATAR